MDSPKTTWYGGLGEMFKVAAAIAPPPFNLIAIGLGGALSALGFFFAQDQK